MYGSFTGTETAASAFCTGVVMFVEGDYQNALSWFAQAKKVRPHANGLYKYIGYCHFKLGNYRRAIRALQIAHVREPNNALICLNIGHCYAMRKAYDAAAQWYQLGLIIEPYNALLHQELGIVLMHQYKLDEALSELSNGLLLDRSLFGCFYNIGVIFQEWREYGIAIYYQERALKLVPRNQKILQNLADLHRKLGKPEREKHYIARLWEAGPFSAYLPATTWVC